MAGIALASAMTDEPAPPASVSQVGFLIVDADVGLSFARRAADAEPGSETRERNLVNAEMALEAVRYHATQVTLDDADSAALDARLLELSAHVRALRE